MIDTYKLLEEVCESKEVCNPDIDLFETGLLDSLAFIELFSRLEDAGIDIQPTRIDRNRLRTPSELDKLIKEYQQGSL